ncbi:MAG: type II toxin-antitoxin system prevent-host-death family antitoxin [Chloroflexi bacterium]|nr:type II toxin-antitoxin system prevent-host-death family antitoxin [Chloroflexota bacterium]
MEKVGIRELRQKASAIIRRVATGETFEVTDRGRVVALLVGVSSEGLAGLLEQGLVRPADGDLLDVKPLRIAVAARRPSSVVAEGRDE